MTPSRLEALPTASDARSERQILEALARQVGWTVHPRPLLSEVSRAGAGDIPRQYLREKGLFPFREEESGALVVALADPFDAGFLHEVELALGEEARPVLAPRSEILDAVNLAFMGGADQTDAVLEQLRGENGVKAGRIEDLLDSREDAPLVHLVNLIFSRALQDRASDIHIEPFGETLKIRFRVDGVLTETLSPPKGLEAALVSRIKVMAGLDLAEHRRPQDGRVQVVLGGRPVDVRVSIVPTAHGERVVLRLLDTHHGLLNLEETGLAQEQLGAWREMVRAANGMVLVTGPTGSGKTTTLYATLKEIDTSLRNVLTIEDPVEYDLPGIGQMQVNPAIGLTFAQGLRSILRQDPDVILVGEIRDAETAKIAIQASLTGHLVLATLHTNDTPGAIVRLIEMGVDPFLVASTLLGCLGQRLVRKLCPHCKRRGTVAAPRVQAEFAGGSPVIDAWSAEGCTECNGRGYKGRVGLFEVFRVDPSLRELIIGRADSKALAAAAAHYGYRPLSTKGWRLAEEGVTSLDEVVRVLSGN